VEADVFQPAEGNILSLDGKGARIPPGSESRACRQRGSPRNLGGPVISTEKMPGRGTRITTPRPTVEGVCSIVGTKEAGTEVVSEGEGDEA
jgi:hypothetical protein